MPLSGIRLASSLKLAKLHSEEAIDAIPPKKLNVLFTFVVDGFSPPERWPTSNIWTVPVFEQTVKNFYSMSNLRSNISAGFVPLLNSASASPVLAFHRRTRVP